MTDVLMPRLSDSMEQGTILTWLGAEGDTIVEGQDLVEIETDKATMTRTAEDSGVLSIVVGEGETVAVGEVIARLSEVGAAADDGGGTPEGAEPEGGAVADDGGTASDGAAVDTARPATGSGAAQGNGDGAGDRDVAATPMARRIAHAHGVALASLTGSGPRGRVVRADVLAAAGLAPEPATDASPAPRPPSAAPDPPPTDAPRTRAGAPGADGGARGKIERVAPSRLQQLIARRMAEAKATIPEFQVQTEVEMTAALAFRGQLKTLASAGGLPTPSLNDLIVKACALALRQHPRANGSYVDGGFELHARVNVGIAVAADDALVVPVLHDADAATLGQIAARSRQLAESVRAGTITPPELSGATFTVSNLGMYGMTAITPVINPPQAAILGVGAIRDALGRDDDGQLVDRRLLSLTLSCDHRILYGADAAQFLAAIRDVLERPLTLAL